ncbi:MAG: hypothetical protein NTW01_03365 [Gammaproteobacteria bacterium]|jgi:hypothetical protein|uniref:hypothetical protein n=1 Tax=Nevskia sp. TaxID=1929292 RepID=UPI004035D732|nr:hypothetical protein [Gammaproteobacteria bacterium]
MTVTTTPNADDRSAAATATTAATPGDDPLARYIHADDDDADPHSASEPPSGAACACHRHGC